MKNDSSPITRLRAYRRSWGLTQQDLAGLLGGRSPTQIARIEAGKRVPGLEFALACQVIFGVPPETVFPQIYTDVEERTVERIYSAHEGLSNTTKIRELRKRDLYDRALERAITRLSIHRV